MMDLRAVHVWGNRPAWSANKLCQRLWDRSFCEITLENTAVELVYCTIGLATKFVYALLHRSGMWNNFSTLTTGFLWHALTTMGWIGIKFGINIHGAQRMNSADFGDSLTFPLAPPLSLHLWFCLKCLNDYWVDWNELRCRHSCPLQKILICPMLWLMTNYLLNEWLPSTSAVLCVYC